MTVFHKSCRFFLAGILCLVAQFSMGQGWSIQHPYPTAGDLRDIAVKGNDTCMIVGTAGTVLISPDHGQSFNLKTSAPLTDYFAALASANPGEYLIGGIDEIIYFTTNGGQSFQRANNTLFTGGAITSFQSLGGSKVLATCYNGRLLYSSDFGRNWSVRNTGMWSLYAAASTQSGDTILAVGMNHDIMRSVNGGQTFTDVNNGGFSLASLRAASIHKSGLCLAGGDAGILYKSLDFGATWQLQIMAFSDTISNIIIVNDTTYRFICSGGAVYETVNGGGTYDTLVASSRQRFNKIAFSGNVLVGIGNEGSVKYSADTAQTWLSSSRALMFQDLRAVYFLDDSVGYAAGGQGNVLRTLNGGKDWRIVAQVGTTSTMIRGIKFRSAAVGYISGTGGFFAATADSGKTWQTKNVGTTANLITIEIAPNGLYVGGFNKSLYRSTDGGNTFSALNVPFNQTVTSVQFLSEKIGYLSATRGNFAKTIDGGNTWKAMITNTTEHLQSCFFVDTLVGWVAGWDNTILATLDGGDTWNPQPTGHATADFWSIKFNDAYDGWAIGNSGKISHTTNGGATWVAVTPPVYSNIYALSFVNYNNGWAVGDQGLIAKFTGNVPVGIKNMAFESSIKVWPNPAENTLFVAADFANAKVTDLSGKLHLQVNQHSGNSIDIKSLPSGVYMLNVYNQQGVPISKSTKFVKQ